MSLVQHQHRPDDLWTDDLFSHAEVLDERLLNETEPLVNGYDLDEEWPVTLAQRQMLEGHPSPWCRISLILPRQSAPDVARIRSIWKQLCSLHCCLRTVLRTDPVSSQVFQRVLYQTPDIHWNIDGTTPASSSNSSQLESAGDDHAAQLLVRRDASSGGLRLTFRAHRALVDGTSLELIKRNFVRLYCDLPVHEHTPLASYYQFLEQTKNPSVSAEFWKGQLSGAFPPHALPWRTRLSDSSPAQERRALTLHLDETSHPGLARLEHASGLSRKLIFETLWAYVLHCHTGSNDIVFAVVERDASFPGAASCLGYLDNTYPMRVAVDGEELFVDVSTRISKFHESGSTHAFLGYDEIAQYLHCEVESVLRYSPDASGPTMAGQWPSFPLALFVNGTSPANVTLCHSTMISSTDAKLLLEHFCHALYSALDQFYLPHTRLEKLDLQSRGDKLNQIHTARSLAQPHKESTIPALFEEQVTRSPNTAAVQFEEDPPLTYAELNARANRLARILAAHEIKGRVVPICIDRSVTLIIALIAVLKAGAAYTVLDPAGPVERNQRIIATCGAELVLTTDAYASQYPEAMILQSSAGTDNSLSSSNLNIDIQGVDRCYVVFTSGSTGAPKGAVITHGAATNGMAYFSLNGLQRWLLFYNPTFSAAQRTMLSTLVHGGTLLLASKQRLTGRLSETVQAMQVEAMGITPSALSVIRPQDVPSLKMVTLVGEKIPRELVATWAEHVHLRNTFGLSECAQLNFGCRLHATSNPGIVGRPTDTTQAYVLKPGTIELAPMGVAGELCLAGPQLAAGYLTSDSDSAGTAADVFVPNPFGFGMMYRTRDMARMHTEGIEILGRLDFQAKINGQKINPAEIDRTLSHHPGIAQCAVVTVEMRNKPTLVAAIVPFPGQSWPGLVASLRLHASEKLPAYMVPSLWMEMRSLPTNSNGKTDVRSIRAQVLEVGWDALVAAAVSSHSEPLTDPVEIQIASVWADVLSLPVGTINYSTSFLSLGGTSIEGIKVINELRKLGLSIDLNPLLGNSPLREVAASAQQSEGTRPNLEPFDLIADAKLRQELQQDAAIADAYPATPLQEGLLASIDSAQGMYTYQRVWDISRLDLGRLQSSVRTVFAGSDILRTSFIPHGRGLLQVVRKDLELDWTEVSCRLEDYLAQDKERPFSLSGPLIRVAVTPEQRLVVTTHHALFDFWSHRFLYEDVARDYLGMSLQPRPPFKEFVGHLMSTPKSESDAFWATYLKDIEPSILNTVPVPQTKVSVTRLPWNRQRQALKEQGISAGSVLYAAWAVVLSQHVRHSDVGFVTTLSGRDAPVTNIDRMDGPTLTSVPQRVSVSLQSTLIELAHSVRDGFLRVLKYSQHGIRHALAAAGLGANHFDTLVNILVKDEDSAEVTQVFRRHGERPIWHSEFTTLEIEESGEELLLRLSSQMEPRRVEFLLESYVAVVGQFVNAPTQRIADLTIMGEEERRFLSNTLSNRDTLHVPEPSLLHSRFETFAREQPSIVAINWDATEAVSYAHLDARATRLANFLMRAGVQVGEAVPLMLDKSIDTIVAILGVMKAGAAYVPLSPDNPVDRNAFIVSDVGARFALAHKEYLDLIRGDSNLKVLRIDDPEIDALPDTMPDVQIATDGIAYIIYTSGSTGMPKGVKVPHQAAAAAVTSMAKAEGRYSGEWRTVQFANYVFDASVQDIFNTLSTGGTLCMAPSDKMQSNLPGVIQEMSARQAILTPTVARLLDPDEVPSFDTLIVGGEPLTPDVIARWSGRRILNVYGPTETSMVITTKEVDPTGRPGNIGAPFPTVMAFLLDPDGTTLVPYGSVGELCVAGPQVTAGYVNREDLTRAAFVEDVLGTSRLYRTGDLARWLPGGELECLGRKDNQVKIHGHRIELAEIEQAILKTGLVQGAAVLGVSVKGSKQLVAFCVFQPGACEILPAEDHEQVARELLSSLTTVAHYMVPKYIIPVGDFPKMPSRKTDRKLLAKWVDQLDVMTLSKYAFEGSGAQDALVPVATENESQLQHFWSQVLALPPTDIGRNSHFLSLGGDSIAAISVTSMARKAGFALTVKDILKNPVLEQLAALMRIDDRQEPVSMRPAFQTPPSVIDAVEKSGLSMENDVEYVYPCPPGQAQFLDEGDRPEQMWVLMASRRMSRETKYEDWIEYTTRLAEINDILRTSWMRSSETEWVGVVLRSSTLDVQVISCTDDEERSTIMEAFWEERFAFGKPFVKYAILLHPDSTWELVIKMNHAAYDGTLLRIFDDHFGAIVQGKPVPAHGEFKDFASHIHRSIKDQSLQFWRQNLQGKTYTWPEAPNPKVTATVRHMVPRNLESVARAQGVTVSILFQAAYQLWLARASNRSDISFDYLLSGRNVDLGGVDPQTINGTLANFLPVRCTISPQERLREFLAATQDMFWAITENGNVGLQEIFAAAGLSPRTAKNHCLFLYQPFEPSANGANEDTTRWLVMAKSQVRMYQPYALVVEVAKALNHEHRLTVMYDADVFTSADAEGIAKEIARLTDLLASCSSDETCLGDLLGSCI